MLMLSTYYEMTTTDAIPPKGTKPIQLTLPLPNSIIGSSIHLHLTIHATSVLLFLTTSSGQAAGDGFSDASVSHPGEGEAPSVGGRAALGSMVYAMPDRLNPPQTLSTPLFTIPSTIDTTMRIAKILARRLKMPVYVGNSMHFGMMGNGGDTEEEMGVLGRVVGCVVGEVEKVKAGVV